MIYRDVTFALQIFKRNSLYFQSYFKAFLQMSKHSIVSFYHTSPQALITKRTTNFAIFTALKK